MSAKEYREYAAECMDWARSARTDQERDTFIQIAKTWLNATLVSEMKTGPVKRNAKPDADKATQEHRAD
jgi:hypothetical protein